MFNKWRRPYRIYAELVSSHQSDFRGFFICFSFVDSELFGALYFGLSVNFNRFGNFYNYYIYFFNEKSVLAFKNMFPLLYFCRLIICYVDTHVKSHAIKINSVAICSRSKFNLTGLIVFVICVCVYILRLKCEF